jgi:hypothetical protein
MLVNWGKSKVPIHVLLDTGCSVPLISRVLVDEWNILCLEYENISKKLGNWSILLFFTGET